MVTETAMQAPLTGRQRTWRRVKLALGITVIAALSALGGVGMALGLLSSSASQ